MIRTFLSVLLIAPVVAMAQPGKTPAKKATPGKPTIAGKPSGIKTSLDSFSYAIGLNIASNLKSQGIGNVNSAMVVKAFNDVFAGVQPAMDMAASNQVVQQRFSALAEQKAGVEKQASTKFLADNKKRPEIKTTASGLQYEILKAGTGPKPADTSTVKVHYTGTLLSGKKFDSSVDRGQPVELRVTGVIPGWTEALLMMPVGSKWKLYIPSELAYGDRGAGQDIPPGATLIFDIELLDIVQAAANTTGQ
jgi:FKBP-type peptidyl-prolyl cis-trans isomerase FklB